MFDIFEGSVLEIFSQHVNDLAKFCLLNIKKEHSNLPLGKIYTASSLVLLKFEVKVELLTNLSLIWYMCVATVHSTTACLCAVPLEHQSIWKMEYIIKLKISSWQQLNIHISQSDDVILVHMKYKTMQHQYRQCYLIVPAGEPSGKESLFYHQEVTNKIVLPEVMGKSRG